MTGFTNKLKTEHYVLAGLVVISIIFRLSFSLSSNTYDNDESYYALRQIESLENHGTLLYDDQLSYSGRNSVFMPGFYYAIYVVKQLFPNQASVNIILNILASLSIVAVYLIVLHITRNVYASLFSSFISIFVPIYLIDTTNTLSQYSMAMPLLLFSLYLFMRINERKTYISVLFISCIIAFSLSSGLIFMLSLTMLTYILLLEVEEIGVLKARREAAIFTLLITLWIILMIYKKALILHGISIIWQNIPREYIYSYYQAANIFQIIYYIGIIPFICGLYVIYRYSFKMKDNNVSIFLAMCLAAIVTLVFRLIKLNVGMTIFGFSFAIFFGMYFKSFLEYVKSTKFEWTRTYIVTGILLIFVFTSVIPSYALLYYRDRIQQEKIEALLWIKANTPNNSTVLGTPDEGNLISYISGRKNVIDSNYLLIKDISSRVADIRTVYTSPIATVAIELLDFYHVDYIFLDNARTEYDIRDIRYAGEKCMRLVYTNAGIKVYRVDCNIQPGRVSNI